MNSTVLVIKHLVVLYASTSVIDDIIILIRKTQWIETHTNQYYAEIHRLISP